MTDQTGSQPPVDIGTMITTQSRAISLSVTEVTPETRWVIGP